MKGRFFKTFIVAFATTTMYVITAFATPQTMADGGIFDAEFYAQTYPDVAAALGTDVNVLYQHYLSSGKAEGRLPYAESSSVGDIKQEQINAITIQIEKYRTTMKDAAGRIDLETTENAKNQDRAEAKASAQQVVALNNQYKILTGEDYTSIQDLPTGGQAIIPCVIHTSAGDVVPSNLVAEYDYIDWNDYMYHVIVPSDNVAEGTQFNMSARKISTSGFVDERKKYITYKGKPTNFTTTGYMEAGETFTLRAK